MNDFRQDGVFIFTVFIPEKITLTFNKEKPNECGYNSKEITGLRVSIPKALKEISHLEWQNKKQLDYLVLCAIMEFDAYHKITRNSNFEAPEQGD